MLLDTATLDPALLRNQQIKDAVYNGTDAAVTSEVYGELRKFLNEDPAVYNFARAIQAPALEMMLRGWLVDESARQRGLADLSARMEHLQNILNRYSQAIWDRDLNPRSRQQLLTLFHKHMGLPEIWTSKKGVKKLSMDREALEKLQQYFYAMPLIAVILEIRDLAKQHEVLSTEVDPDGRMRTSYNIAGTETGRWSSSASAFATGSNLQNINPRLRHIFVADHGWKLCGIDLEQAESREVGLLLGVLFGDWTYLDACEGGDLHTFTARLIWPDLPWTGDIKRDRKIAEQIFYRDFTYRDMSKRGGHGTTYYGTPFTMARHLKVPIKLMESFRDKFLGRAFPGIPRWHRWTAEQLQTTQQLTTMFGRTRHFFGRPNDDTTLREAIAFCPQSATADRTNLGLWRLWNRLRSRIRLLHQNHDAVYFLYREEEESDIIPQALSCMEIVTTHNGRAFTVPGEAQVGWNWGKHHDESKPLGSKNKFNPNGLKKWRGGDKRRRLVGLEMPA